MEIIDKLEAIKEKWEALGEQLNDPEIIGDMKRFVKVNKDYKDLEPIVVAFKEYKNLLSNIEEAREIWKNAKDEDMREMAQEEGWSYRRHNNTIYVPEISEENYILTLAKEYGIPVVLLALQSEKLTLQAGTKYDLRMNSYAKCVM